MKKRSPKEMRMNGVKMMEKPRKEISIMNKKVIVKTKKRF